MTKNKKYDYQVTQTGGSWSAAITRKVNSREVVISKAQDGFASESAAQLWAEGELQTFLQALRERNERRAKARG